MKIRFLPLLFVACAACAAAPQTQPTETKIAPPLARREPHPQSLHGQKLDDDYFWLRQKGAPAVEDYLKAENAYTASVMKPTERFQDALYAEMLGRIQEDDVSVPHRKNGYYYYSRTEKGKQYPIFCR